MPKRALDDTGLRGLLDAYWQMCGTLAAADQFDAALAMRMLRHRERVGLVEFLMPEPRWCCT